MPCDTQAEEIIQGDTDGDDDARPKDAGGVNELVPTPRKVKERRAGSN